MAFDPAKRIETLQDDLHDLHKKRDWIDTQIVNVNLALRSLARGIKDPAKRADVLRKLAAHRRKPGLTEAISDMFRRMPYAEFSAKEVCSWLERIGVDLSGYSQPLSTISITLRRLGESGRLKVSRKGRNVTYRWNGD